MMKLPVGMTCPYSQKCPYSHGMGNICQGTNPARTEEFVCTYAKQTKDGIVFEGCNRSSCNLTGKMQVITES